MTLTMQRGKLRNRILLAVAMFAAALQVLSPAFAASHATDHAVHDAMVIAGFGDLTAVTVGVNPPVHGHDHGDTCSVDCATCKSKIQGAALVLKAYALATTRLGLGPSCLFATTIAPCASLGSLAAPRAPPALIS